MSIVTFTTTLIDVNYADRRRYFNMVLFAKDEEQVTHYFHLRIWQIRDDDYRCKFLHFDHEAVMMKEFRSLTQAKLLRARKIYIDSDRDEYATLNTFLTALSNRYHMKAKDIKYVEQVLSGYILPDDSDELIGVPSSAAEPQEQLINEVNASTYKNWGMF